MSIIRNMYSKRVSKAFNNWAESYEDEVIPKLIKRKYSYAQLADFIIKELDIMEGQIILEMGVGPGVLGGEIKRQSNVQLIGLDISRKMLDEAAKKNVYEYLINSSAEDRVFADSSFNSIYSTFMFHSVFDQNKTLNEIERLLKKNGKAIIVDLFPASRKPRFVNLIKGSFHSMKYEYGAPANYKSVDNLFEMLKKFNLEITSHGKLGMDKDYNHYYFTFKKE